MKKVIISLLALSLIMIFALTSCRWFKTEEPHECESLCAECGGCLNGECQDSACAKKCEGHIPPHKCEHICEECDGCLDAECEEEACAEKCSCHNKDTLCPECGGCVYTGCKEAICLKKCSCPKCVNVDEEILKVLLNHLENLSVCYDLTPWDTEKQIKEIQGGMTPLLVTFDSVSTYYIGVYFSGEHHLPDYPYESGDYCCSNHYVWVRFDSFEEIERTYNNRDILTIFAIREVSSVSDIRSSDADVPEFVVYEMLYYYIFKDDEIQPPTLTEKSFIYLIDGNADTVYYNPGSHLKYFYRMSCILIDNEYYLIYPHDLEYLKYEFGEYYDTLNAISQSYSEINSSGKEFYYIIIKVSDFAELLKGE